MQRPDGRDLRQLRPLEIQRGFLRNAEGSALGTPLSHNNQIVFSYLETF